MISYSKWYCNFFVAKLFVANYFATGFNATLYFSCKNVARVMTLP